MAASAVLNCSEIGLKIITPIRGEHMSEGTINIFLQLFSCFVSVQCHCSMLDESISYLQCVHRTVY